jgi:diacylglycerol kinase family enzyme
MTVDLGLIEYAGDQGPKRRYFVNVAGVGFDGAVVERQTREGKRGGGTIPYLLTLVVTLLSYQNKTVTLTVDTWGHTGRFNSVIVCNGKYFGGGMYIAPGAQPDDGLFDVVTIGDTTRLEFLLTVPRVYNGTHLTHPKLHIYRAQTVHVASQQPMFIQADGEYVGRAPATFQIVPRALQIKV